MLGPFGLTKILDGMTIYEYVTFTKWREHFSWSSSFFSSSVILSGGLHVFCFINFHPWSKSKCQQLIHINDELDTCTDKYFNTNIFYLLWVILYIFLRCKDFFVPCIFILNRLVHKSQTSLSLSLWRWR